MKPRLKAPEFEKTRRDHGLTEEQRLELAGRQLIEVLELAEALPYSPRWELDLPRRVDSKSRAGAP